jgi:hypothetical protein
MHYTKKLLNSLPKIKLNDIISSIEIHKKEQEIKKIVSKNNKKILSLRKNSY